jgi:hypothetical protein
MCPIETGVTLAFGPSGLDVLGLTVMLVLYALRVAQQGQLLRPAAALRG